ncbi:MAG: hypothetical protein MI974_19790 [Chitinophagales bacterium]|nr:hypothetical protein [Chitinophagales bacterium]
MTNKITIAVLAITAILMSSCQLDTGNHFSEKENIYTVEEIEGRSSNITIIEDIVMLVNTGIPSLHVDRVDVFDDQNIYITTFNGCSNQKCQIDISSLSTGTYEAIAYPSIGSTFSKVFTLSN